MTPTNFKRDTFASVPSFVARLSVTFLISSMAVCAPVMAQDAAGARTLDELLNQVKKADQKDAALNAEREARFAAARDQQASLLADAKRQKEALEAEAAGLQRQFEANDKEIADLMASRDASAGNLGELFGVMRQSAGDFASAARNSMLTVQFPERIAQLDRLAQTKTMPPIEDLQGFWFEMQREMTEGGKIARFDASVTEPSGEIGKKPVTRIGPFVAISDGKFLSYETGATSFAVPPKQPGGHFQSTVRSFESTASGYAPMVVDPSRGVLIGLYSQRPEIMERVHVGGWVAYLILLVGAIGAILAVYQFVYLTVVSSKVGKQLANLDKLSNDNPVGRVLLAFKGASMPKDEDAEVVELRISEAVLKELPAIQRVQPFVKLVVAAGPLLGLVGTVIGMIETFQSITESGSGDPKLMAAGIGKAMIATVLGLGIAIPLLFINSALASRSKRLVQILDQQSTGLLAETLEARQGHGTGAAHA
ncbi:MAG: MotA/TolQ/ExbB proton channel family protein [Xanthomonadaceae bacterium]|nr:MotA/TolQ/ExbB proton channel family protein [Xanthomonadaceae bacterium]